MKVDVAVIGPVVSEPLTFLMPLHAPVAPHITALLLVQVSVAELPDLTEPGVA